MASVLTFSAVTLALFACGGGGGEAGGAKTPQGETPAADGGAAATPASGGDAGAAGFTGEMKPVKPSAMIEDLKKIGLDPKKLPPLNKIEPEKLRQVMKTFTKSMGVKCTACHEANDFRAPTPNKKVTIKMWDEYTRGLVMEDGNPVYCDSCHDGQTKVLDRHDMRALGQYMDKEYVGKMKRVDKKDHGCETCHGDPFESNIVKMWSK